MPDQDVQSNAASPEDVRDALASQGDPDVVQGQQATTTAEAQEEARKILKRVGQRESDVSKLRQDIEENAEASKSALIRAQRFMLQSYPALMPSEQELASRQAAAMMRPNPGVGMSGAPIAMGANFQGELAAEEEEKRKALAGYLSMASGEPLQEAISKINTSTFASRQKLLEMMQRSDTELGRSAMTALGRMVSTPAAQAALKPNSPYGKIAIDEGLQVGTPEYTARVHELAQADVADKKARAGLDEVPLTPEEKFDNANLSGVPFHPRGLPDISRMSAQQRKQFLNNEAKTVDKVTAQNGSEDEQIRAALRALDQFQELNKTTYTGPLISPFVLGGAHAGPHGVGVDLSQERGGLNLNPMSWAAQLKGNIQTMQKDAAQVVAMAIPSHGFGRVTNRDLNLFQQGSIGTDKVQGTNDAIAQALRIRLGNDLERHQFEQAYSGLHGSLRGAESAWNDYINDNPIFDPDPKAKAGPNGVHPLNPNRMKWQDYFRQKNNALHSAPIETLPEQPSHLTRAQLHGVDPNDPVLQGLSDEDKIGATTPAQAEGGRVHLAEGGEPDKAPQPDSDVRNSLNALINGLTLRAAGRPEDPNSPMENLGGEFAGATGTALAALAALRRPARIARFMAEHPHLTASGAGALAGGVSGEMGEGDPTTGALAGAMLGPAGRMITKGGFRGVNDILDHLRGEVIGPGTRRSIGAIEADTGGDWDKVANVLSQDAKAKVPSILGEVGPRSLGLTRAAIGRDTPASAGLLSSLEQRQAGAPERVAETVNKGLAPDDYAMKAQQLRDTLYTRAAPLYDQAFAAFPSVKTQSLQALMSRPAGQEAAARAFISMQNKGLPIGAPDATGMLQSPSLQYLDQIKRALDDMIVREEGVGATYQATEAGRDLRGLRSSLVDELDKATVGPQGQPSPYRAARDQYAGDLEVMDALRTGRESFDKLTPSDVQALMQKLDFSSRDAFRTGVAEGIFQRIGNMGPNRNAAQAVINNPNLQQKLMAIFDNPAQAQKFITNLQREAETFGSGQMLTKQGEKGQLTSMQPTSISSMLRAQLMRPSTAGEVSETMRLTPNDPQAKEKLARLRAAADRLRGRSDASNLVGTAGAAGASAALTPSMLSQQDQQ